MLHRIGASSVEELFAEVPPEGRVQGLLRLPQGGEIGHERRKQRFALRPGGQREEPTA